MDLIKDDDFATELWEALANITWVKTAAPGMTDDDLVAILSGDTNFSASWRGAGGVVAALRNVSKQSDYESYMSWYMSGDNPGTISDRIMEMMTELNWEPIKDDYYRFANP